MPHFVTLSPASIEFPQKFCGNGQLPWLGSKFCVPRKTVVPSHDCPLLSVGVLLSMTCRSADV